MRFQLVSSNLIPVGTILCCTGNFALQSLNQVLGWSACPEEIILKACVEFLNHENGQIAIYDAVNPLSEGRKSLAKEFSKHEVETLFIESACDDEKIIEENVRSVKISSPDYIGWSSDAAVKHYLARMSAKIPNFETMEETDLNYIKMINAGERITVNNCSFGYLSHRYVK